MTSALKTMHIDLRVGQSLRLGDAVLTLQEKSGRMARLTVRAPEAVQVRQQQPGGANIPRSRGCSMTPLLYDGAISFLAALPPAGVKLRSIFVDRQYTPAPMHQTMDDIPRCAVLPHAGDGCAYIVLCATVAGATRLLMATPYQPGAQECASSPHWGSKEQAHG